MCPQPLFVAPSGLWTRDETISAFAAERWPRELTVTYPDGSFSGRDGVDRFRLTIVSTGVAWVFAVFADGPAFKV